MIRYLRLTLLVIFHCLILIYPFVSFGQTAGDTAKAAVPSFAERVSTGIRKVAERSRNKYRDETVLQGQQRTLDNIQKEVQAAKLFMKSELDTSSLANEIREASESFSVVKGGMAAGEKALQTHRNLNVSTAILTQLLRDMSLRKTNVDLMAERVAGYRYKLDSLATDSLLYTISTDSAKIVSYFSKLRLSNLSIGPVDSLIEITLSNLKDFQGKLDPLVFELDFALESLEAEKGRLSGLIFTREFPNIWQKARPTRPFTEILKFSWAKERMAFEFYLMNYLGRFLILLLALTISTIFLRSLGRRYAEHPSDEKNSSENLLVLRYPILVSILIVISLFQFIFLDPPFIINFLLWLISAVSLTFIFRTVITRYWFIFWLNIFGVFVAASLCNFILLASQTERWIMLLLALLGVGYGVFILTDRHLEELKERYIIYALRFMVACEALSFFLNIYGRFNLSKTLMMAGFVGMVVAILFLWTVRLIDDTLRLANSIYKNPDRKLFYVNFDRVGNKTPTFLYVLLCLGWVIMVGRSYYEYKQIVHPFNQFITEARKIGDYDFTIRDMLLFFGISGASVMISRFVSFFATEPGLHASDAPKAGTSIAANWLLLIRILVITTGILLAFAASGIPLDRLTIVLGALGVGIGLGLQNLVSNLVSGLIIAFERPVSVGDQVEVNGKLGTMKSVGFRSSIITLFDGSCMIVPNGDLLSQHLINWTMGRDRRRLIISIGVAYGTDLGHAKKVALEMLSENDKIMSRPQPLAIANDFNASSIELLLIFWVKNLDLTLAVRDEVIEGIDNLFREHNISIPVAQHDVYVRSIPVSEKKE